LLAPDAACLVSKIIDQAREKPESDADRNTEQDAEQKIRE
jgi:hypothetical protein